MSAVGFKNLFSVTVNHDFFRDGVFKALVAQPDACTKKLINKKGLIFKSEVSRFSVYYPLQFDVDVVKDLAHSSQVLTFQMYSDDAQFINFTNTSFESLNYFKYSNLKLSPERFNELVPEMEPVGENLGVIATLEIHAKTFLEPENGLGADYQINFKARQTPWVYYIIESSTREQHETLRVTDHQGRRFEGPQQVRLSNGGLAARFYSGSIQYPTLQAPTGYCLLKSVKPDRGVETLISQLPTASPTSLNSLVSVPTAPTDGLASSMYVYL